MIRIPGEPRYPPSTSRGIPVVRNPTGGIRAVGGSRTPRGGVPVARVEERRRPPGSDIRVAVVEPESLFRTMLAGAIDRAPGLRTVVQADSISQARDLIAQDWIDVIVIEVGQVDGNGATLALDLQRSDPRLSVVAVTRHDVRAMVESTRRHLRRPWSYVSKLTQTNPDDLVETIRAAAMAPDNTPARPGEDGSLTPGPFEGITAQQLAVLRLISEGFTNGQVAAKLGLSRRTVENHLLGIYRAFEIDSDDVNPRVSAVLRFLTHSIRY
jgi:DNA-binding NarL/FixJ family response regulator